MKILKWIGDNILFLCTLFLLAFIPLYPKLPLLDVVNTWVYVRAEDFIAGIVLLIWLALVMRRKITLQTPLTIPILLFWLLGGLATIHGVLLIFPHIANVFPNVAFLSFLRRIEYISVFFIAFAAMKDKRFLTYVIWVVTGTFLGVFLYGIAQKYLGFPAYLTMNEEYAKGVAIHLSSLSRVPSTFAGHYDLAAYLVLVIPILASLFFGFRNILLKTFFSTCVVLGLVLLFMTVSRVSFLAVFVGLFSILLFQKKKLVLFILPVVGAVTVLLFLTVAPTLLGRFTNTVQQTDVLVDAKTGNAIGNLRYVEPIYFKEKTIKEYSWQKNPVESSPSALATSSAILYTLLPPQVPLLVASNISNGENLPEGTGYINLSLSPVTKRLSQFFYEIAPDRRSPNSPQILVYYGDFLVKRVSAYDLSFTTRFQGEWPNAMTAFSRNVLFGSGYGSISLAIDNNYLRILGEVGLLGFISFFGIFVAWGIYAARILPDVDSPVARSFVIGLAGGIIGLLLNATLIDVFEASKVAFVLWLLMGATMGILSLYGKRSIQLSKQLLSVATSPYAVIVYLFGIATVVFSPMLSNFFVGDDFTWFRWAADCTNGMNSCSSPISTIWHYFIEANGFFYRPGTKTFFLFMYKLFWLNQTVYHMISIFLHFLVSVLVFFLARKILRDYVFSVLAAGMFLILSGYAEVIFWISSIGFLFNAFFVLLGLFLFTLWEEKRKNTYFVTSMISLLFALLFHELGVVGPLLLIVYKLFREKFNIRSLQKIQYGFLFIPDVIYFFVRYIAGSHWFSGDYNYNLLKLPFNFIGNIAGYGFLILFGPSSLSFYETVRNFSKNNVMVAGLIALTFLTIIAFVVYLFAKKIKGEDRNIILFGSAFFVVALLPFVGLGNITSRYSYLASVGFVLLFAFCIKKLYYYLQNSGRTIALLSLSLVLMVFSLLHIIEIQQMHNDWRTAGDKVQKFFVAIDGLYGDDWAKTPMKFYFVNVPIKSGEAWVFPVGLPDALWLVFRNAAIDVYQMKSLQEAYNTVHKLPNEKIFEFQDDGSVVLKEASKTAVPRKIR